MMRTLVLRSDIFMEYDNYMEADLSKGRIKLIKNHVVMGRHSVALQVGKNYKKTYTNTGIAKRPQNA